MTARLRRHNFFACMVLGLASTVAAASDVSEAAQSFDALAQQVKAKPQDLSAGNELRSWCREQRSFDMCIAFFDELVSAHPQVQAARYNAALAYIDKLPGNSILVQARLSTHSIEHATAVLEHSPDDWMALYIRGLNNLYWPKWYRRVPRAVEDLSRCVQVGEALPAAERKPHMALSYVALGDAYVKLEQLDQARQTWQRGVQMIGESQELRLRLDTATEGLPQLIEQIRSREAPVDTDLRRIMAAGRP